MSLPAVHKESLWLVAFAKQIMADDVPVAVLISDDKKKTVKLGLGSSILGRGDLLGLEDKKISREQGSSSFFIFHI